MCFEAIPTSSDLISRILSLEKLEALVDALSANEGLMHLGLRHSTVDDGYWNNLVRAVSKHPTLLTLTFENICDKNNSGFLKRRDQINVLAGML
jgi:hypothetical protein